MKRCDNRQIGMICGQLIDHSNSSHDKGAVDWYDCSTQPAKRILTIPTPREIIASAPPTCCSAFRDVR